VFKILTGLEIFVQTTIETAINDPKITWDETGGNGISGRNRNNYRKPLICREHREKTLVKQQALLFAAP